MTVVSVNMHFDGVFLLFRCGQTVVVNMNQSGPYRIYLPLYVPLNACVEYNFY